MDQLPYDVVVSILDAIDDSQSPLDATQIFHALSLTSTVWARPAQTRLYTRPCHPHFTFARASSFLNTLESRPELACRVKELGIGAWTSTLKAEAKVDRRAVSAWAISVLRLCTGLKVLDFPGVTFSDARELESTLEGLHDIEEVIFGDGLRGRDPWIVNIDLGIRDAFGSAVWSVTDVARITTPSRWPKLQFLQIRTPLRRSPNDAKLTCSLRDVTLAYDPNIMIDFSSVSTILDGSRSTLRSLSLFEHQLSPGTFIKLLQEFGSSLTSLSTASLNQHELVSDRLLDSIANHCTALRHLHLGSRFRATASNFSILAQLPRLETLELSSINYLSIPDPQFPRAELVHTEDVAKALESFSETVKSITLGSEDRPLTEWDANILWKEMDVMELEGRLWKNRGVALLCHEFYPAFSGRSLRSLMAWSRLQS